VQNHAYPTHVRYHLNDTAIHVTMMRAMNLSTIPYWLLPTLLLFPALLWMFLGVGLPWALAVLPRADWQHRVTVIAVALALGPALTTTGMFVIGTVGQFTVANVLAVSALIAATGLALARRNRSGEQAASAPAAPLMALDVVLIAVIGLAILVRFWNAAYWPYTTYDEFWVYGYNAEIFMLHGSIPASMGYYPQLIPLTYTYGQLVWGGVNAHAARTVVPVFALASALMAYVFGARLFNRRVGLLAAAIWMLYPQHAAWNQFGDLEVPVTLYFTGTAAFFALGWREGNRRYIVLSGLLMGAALWTKPTAGALIESAGLILSLAAAYWLFRARPTANQPFRQWLASKGVRYPLLALTVAAPMGGMWYIRNVLYGLPALVFPAGYWQAAAQRSGQELGWPLLIAAAVTVALVSRRLRSGAALGGILLVALGTLPSAFGGRLPSVGELSQMIVGRIPITLTTIRLTLLEALTIAVGAALLAWAAIPSWRRLPGHARQTILIVAAFILPYFVTWFWSYSYHFRLSFAIVPALIVLLAAALDAILDRWIAGCTVTVRRRIRILAISAITVALALPGLLAAASALEPAITGALPDDHARIAQGNAALMGLVDYLMDRRDPNRRPLRLDRPMRVEAPGELRLPFFFPLDDIRTERYPVLLDQIAEVDFFVDSSVGQRLYAEKGEAYNQVLASLTRDNVMRRLYTTDDGNFRFSVYAIDDKTRFVAPKPNGPLNVQIGDFAWLSGYDLSTLQNSPGSNIFLTLWWQALQPADLDYSVFIHLWDPRKQAVVGAWGGEPVSGAWSVWQHVQGAHFSVSYHTRLWQPGETIKDEWKIVLPDAPPGAYELYVGLYDPASRQRLPVKGSNLTGSDAIRLPDFTIVAKR
jgi:4-amino-4-deoxy-L-arabinose transferase-like glycosyltransferase